MQKRKPKTEVATPVETSPFYLVWNERGRWPRHMHATYASAMAEAKRLASENPGAFHVLAVVARAEMTQLETAEFRFDPTGDPKPVCIDCGSTDGNCDCIPF